MTTSYTTSQSPARTALSALRNEVSKAVVGQDAAVTSLVIALICRGHVLLEGVPGTAKTLLVRSIAKALRIDTKRVQFTPDLMPGDITGSLVYDARTAQFTFREGPVFTNLVLADEINRTPPKTQAALLEAMEERQVTVDGETHLLPEPFFVVATQNPSFQVGTFPLPESQIDRFLMRIELGYPAPSHERQLLRGRDRRDLLADLPAVLDPVSIPALQRRVAEIHASDALLDYVQSIARASRDGSKHQAGLSPRAVIALLRSAQAWAFLHGHAGVLPEDLQAVLPAVVGHRLRARDSSDARNPGEVAAALLKSVPIP